MGLRGINFAVVNPLSKGLARVPYLEQGVGIVKNLPAKAFDKTGLPPFKQWNLFTVNDNIALRRFLKDQIMFYLHLNLLVDKLLNKLT